MTQRTCVFGASTPNNTFPLRDRFAVKEVPWHFGQADSPELVDTAADEKVGLPNRGSGLSAVDFHLLLCSLFM